MKQWTKKSNKEILGFENHETIYKKLGSIAKAYVPEWDFDIDNPDIGTAIAILFTDMLAENQKMYESISENDYVELINLLGISLRAANPSQGIALMNLVPETLRGVRVRKGTKLGCNPVTSTEEGNELDAEPIFLPNDVENVLFETRHNVYITEADLTTIFMTLGEAGKLVPIKGRYKQVNFINKDDLFDYDEEGKLISLASNKDDIDGGAALADFEQADIVNSEIIDFKPFKLFDASMESYGIVGLTLYHTHMFSQVDTDVVIKFNKSESLMRAILDHKVELKVYSQGEFKVISDIKAAGENSIIFKKDFAGSKIKVGDTMMSMLLMEPVSGVNEKYSSEGISFSTEGAPKSASAVWDGNIDLNVKKFKPFGETVENFKEFYIGCDDYFDRPGADITIDLDMEFETYLANSFHTRNDLSLKIIKKKPPKDIEGTPIDIFVNEIAIEYFNGIGFKAIETKDPILGMFEKAENGSFRMTFKCPEDWTANDVGSYHGKTLRIRILRADNCYYQPGIHHYPIIKNMTISYSYANRFDNPSKAVSFMGYKQTNVTASLNKHEHTLVIKGHDFNDNALYLGFNKKLAEGPISIMYHIDASSDYVNKNVKYFYYSERGFKRLKVNDYTDGLSHADVVLFMPPADMAKVTIANNSAYYIKVVCEEVNLAGDSQFIEKLPVITDIRHNAVAVNNVDTGEEIEYYMDESRPNMTFSLPGKNILGVEVWVNETEQHAFSDMIHLSKTYPSHFRLTYNSKGEPEELFVRWEEVENFDKSNYTSRHFVVDRLSNTLIFGNGSRGRIPKNTRNTAFKVIVSQCDGSSANLPAGSINTFIGNQLYIDSITNPRGTYGGMDMENLDQALHRGSMILGSRKKLISASDYEREALIFSQSISQATVVCRGDKIDLVLLMEDYESGTESFFAIKEKLEEHLREKSEFAIPPENIMVVLPTFVKLDIKLWVEANGIEDTFAVEHNLERLLNEYLSPITGNWEIGRMVSEQQIIERLNRKKGSTVIRQILCNATYTDELGSHDATPAELAGNPYVIVTGGTQTIYFE